MKRAKLVLATAAALLWAAAGSCAWSRWRNTEREQECVRWEAWMVNCSLNGDAIPTKPDPWGTPYAVFVLRGGRYEPEAFAWEGQTVRPAHTGKPHPEPAQVISAGPDRVFGTGDDIHSWDRFEAE